jgi:hypothetical protein
MHGQLALAPRGLAGDAPHEIEQHRVPGRGARPEPLAPSSGLSWRSPTKPWAEGAPIHAPASAALELHRPHGRARRWILRGLVFAVLIVAAVTVILAFK